MDDENMESGCLSLKFRCDGGAGGRHGRIFKERVLSGCPGCTGIGVKTGLCLQLSLRLREQSLEGPAPLREGWTVCPGVLMGMGGHLPHST